MANKSTRPAAKPAAAQAQNTPSAALTPELVREVADKVYALWLLDLKIEQERWRQRPVSGLHSGGGW